jgi:choline dehydrogenase
MHNNMQEDFAERVHVNQHELFSELRTRFDYIVCGAGTSGCVVAARLAADLNTQVLLLEAGGSDETDLITDPNRWPMTLGSELDWGFIAEPNPHLNGRAIPYSMGKVLGGGVRGRWQIEGLRCGRPPYFRCFHFASCNDRQHNGAVRC